ncbi:hypothetical protein, partial [Salmonella sp. s58953]|uniref:hypothetical protein n=1 Tax=Salmonella sp. s58953 TaxID=3159711 RepID=UPI003980D9AF
VGTQEEQVESVESRDRGGLFGFMGTKKEEETKVVSDEAAIVTEFDKVHVSEFQEAKVEKKQEGIFDKMHTSSSSSSDEEEVGEDGEKKKKKKGLKEKLKEKISGEEKP